MIEVRITVGRFVLQVGGPHGTRVDPTPEPETREREQLAEAIRAPTRTAAAADAVSAAVEQAEEVTAAVERTNDLVEALAKGLTLDPKALETQVNALLGVLERADREGRFEDQLRLARALVALLALIPRWLVLVQVLRRVASAAAAVGDRASEAWAKHELGSFALGADDAPEAVRNLTDALNQREALGDRAGAEVTLHNLQMVSLIPPDDGRSWISRHPVIAVVALVALLLAAAGITIAVLDDDSDDGATTSAADTTTAETETDEDTTEAGDTVPPAVQISVPGEFLRGTVELTAVATDAEGVAAVVFEVAPAGTDDFTALDDDAGEPYSFTWDTTTIDDGEYTLRAVATDDAGNEGVSDEVPAVVDNTGPAVTLGTPELANSVITLSAKAEDEVSGVASVVFQLAQLTPGLNDVTQGPWEDVAEATEPVSEPLYEATADASERSSGSYRVRAVAYDNAGNSTESDTGNLTIPEPEG